MESRVRFGGVFLQSTIFAIHALLVAPCFAASFYVDLHGDNLAGKGTSAKPWATLSYACAQVQAANSTIIIGPGTYRDDGQCQLAPGVSIQGGGAGTTVIRSRYGGPYIYGISGSLTNGNHAISGFTLDGDGRTLKTGIYIAKRNNISIHNMEFNRIYDKAIDIHGCLGETEPGCFAKSVRIFDTRITSCARHYGGDNSYGAIHLNALEDVELSGLVMDESATDGQCVKGVYGWLKRLRIRASTFTVGPLGASNSCIIELWNLAEDSEISGNIFNNGQVSFVLGKKGTGSHSLVFQNNRLNNSLMNEFSISDVLIQNNHFSGAPNGHWGGGIGIWPTHQAAAAEIRNVTISRNAFLGSRAAAVYVEDKGQHFSMSDIYVYNNTIDTVFADPWGGDGVLLLCKGSASRWDGFRIVNNAVTGCRANGIVSTYGAFGKNINSMEISHNVFHGNGQANIAVSGTTNSRIYNNQVVAPEIRGSGEKPDPYYRPRDNSANIVDLGMDVGMAYQGAAPDVGAYEYTADSVGAPALPAPGPAPKAPSNLKVRWN